MLDFLGLPGKHTESQLETAILDEIQRFLLELGVGFAFVERQKRMTGEIRAAQYLTRDVREKLQARLLCGVV